MSTRFGVITSALPCLSNIRLYKLLQSKKSDKYLHCCKSNFRIKNLRIYISERKKRNEGRYKAQQTTDLPFSVLLWTILQK